MQWKLKMMMNNMNKGTTIKVLDHGYVRLVDWMGSDQRIVEAARISYNSPSKGPEADEKLLRYLYRNKHMSPFEMVRITLNIKLPIFVMRQMVRHRMQSLNEISARYTEVSDHYYTPEVWRNQDTKNKQGSIGVNDSTGITEEYHQSMESAYRVYQSMMDQGIAREMARMVLPVSVYTQVYSCWDLRNLLGFIRLREDSHAQWEIQEYAKAIKSICQELFPITMSAYEGGK
jgi:thymidylate synthase (FAD)